MTPLDDRGPRWLPERALPSSSPLYQRYLGGEEIVIAGHRHRRPDRETLLARSLKTGGRRIDPGLMTALRESHERMGASPATRRTLDDLEDGRSVLVFAGQQPALCGGPLYVLHKAATAVAVARRLRAAGVNASPAYWIASDDADLDEAGSAYAPGPDRALGKAQLTGRYPEGTLAGDLPLSECRAAAERLFAHAPDRVLPEVERLCERARDFGEFLSALLFRWFADDGMITIDSRLLALRRAARPIVARYLETREEIARRVNEAGDEMERAGFGRPIHPESAASALFVVENGRRRKVPAGADLGGADLAGVAPEAISTGVLLRPFVQEGVFPSAGMVVGPGELAYLVQSEPAVELIGVARSPFVPRMQATWLDLDLIELAERRPEGEQRPEAERRAEGWTALFTDPGPLVTDRLRELLPPKLRESLDRLSTTVREGVARVVSESELLDRGLAQMATAAGQKLDYQIGRIEDQALDRVRRRAAQEGLVLVNIADFVTPRRRPQERSFSLLWLLLHGSGPENAGRLVETAEAALQRLETGQTAHAILAPVTAGRVVHTRS